MHLKPFVKWAGGKSQLLQYLKEQLPKYRNYYEPFVGGGALFFELSPKHAVINDINRSLINTYSQLKENTRELIECIEELDSYTCDSNLFLKLREIYNQKISNDEYDVNLAALMIWLNKHCFNGLYRVNSKGLFNVPYNNRSYGKSIDVDNLRNIGTFLRKYNTSILNQDFEKTCSEVSKGDLVYFDSPYFPLTDTANFVDYTDQGFSIYDHKRLADLFKYLDSVGAYVMLSNHDVPLVDRFYKGFNIQRINVRRAINRDASKRIGLEVIVRNW